MNNARRMAQAVNDTLLHKHTGAPFTLPEPDRDYIIARLIEKRLGSRIDYLKNSVLPYQQEKGFSTADTCAEIAELEALKNQVDTMLITGDITPDEYALIMTNPMLMALEQRRQQMTRYNVHRWIPMPFGTARDGAPVCYIIDPARPMDDNTIWLRHEQGAWIHDNVDPFRKSEVRQ